MLCCSSSMLVMVRRHSTCTAMHCCSLASIIHYCQSNLLAADSMFAAASHKFNINSRATQLLFRQFDDIDRDRIAAALVAMKTSDSVDEYNGPDNDVQPTISSSLIDPHIMHPPSLFASPQFADTVIMEVPSASISPSPSIVSSSDMHMAGAAPKLNNESSSSFTSTVDSFVHIDTLNIISSSNNVDAVHIDSLTASTINPSIASPSIASSCAAVARASSPFASVLSNPCGTESAISQSSSSLYCLASLSSTSSVAAVSLLSIFEFSAPR